MWCSQECWYCKDISCEHYSNELDEFGHTLILKNLEMKFVGKKTPDGTEIIGVDVDYRKDHQHMNRVMDEDGNIWFIKELEDYYDGNRTS